ncbi:peptide ABC transporter substrate-binding protein [Xinfangfangia sp. CPCC 101601]|uniref:Peptide ABC transporter substrate-binding protein n=1 Tax=Pseudogemmobacter lacusdianii TaxID=3069608 RepID=A0ABU0W2W5_9RHOB|nr:peptide ABC transporter substrate-binding protein [Xinfangfangia sp. CPCC 101601]MDQ2068128.1 peptide ABC transporter substrate-binding protein [Xinfangfangia sp. CPCC 101601]
MLQTSLTMNRRKALMFLSAAGVTTALPSLTQLGAAHAQTAPAGQMVVGFSQEPTVFHPHLLHVECDEGVHYAIFDPLFDVDEKGEYFPILAKDVPTVANGGISEDGLTWKIQLRDGVTWHDGKPFTAEDVKFTLELMMNPNFQSWRRAGHELIEEITVVSPTEITWKMKELYAPYLAILASTFIVPKHAFEGQDLNDGPFNQAPIGTGAYKLKNRVPGDHIELEANTEYFGDGPYLERVVIKYIPDLTVMYTQLKTGDIDVLALQWITPDNYAEAQTIAGLNLELMGAPFVEGLSLNLQRPVFQDPKVREALYLATDKATIIDVLYYGVQLATESYMPQQSYFYNPNLPAHSYDLEKAAALLDEAGWAIGDDGVRVKDGLRLSFTCSTTAGNHLREQTQQFIQQSYKEIGVEMLISNLPPAVMWGDHWMLSQFDMALAALSLVSGPDPDSSDYLRSDASAAIGGTGQNTWVYQSAEVDELLAKGASMVDPEQRKPVYERLQEVVRQDLPCLPLFQHVNIRGSKVGVQGLVPNVNNRVDTWNIRSWRWA